MNTILPIEISNIVYTIRANLTLQDICKDYSLNYQKFCDFLIEYKGVLTGSSSLRCLDNICPFNDLDLLVEKQPNKNTYKDFLKVFTIDTSIVDILKNPLDNSICDEKGRERRPDYYYKFEYLGKSIDITILKEPVIEVIGKYNFFEHSKIYFDGKRWNIPFDNIEKFLESKSCRIVNPYATYFDDIYDPWNISIKDEVVKCIGKFKFSNVEIENKKMKYFYETYKVHYLNKDKVFYVDKDEVYHSNQKSNIYTRIIIDKMILVYNKVNGTPDNFKDLIIKLKDVNEIDSLDIPNNEDLHKLYRVYKSVYKILCYIAKGYYMSNINDFLK